MRAFDNSKSRFGWVYMLGEYLYCILYCVTWCQTEYSIGIFFGDFKKSALLIAPPKVTSVLKPTLKTLLLDLRLNIIPVVFAKRNSTDSMLSGTRCASVGAISILVVILFNVINVI
jgi:hypothetical protein